MKHTSPVRFFFLRAGYSYDPARETKLQGRWRCARRLARAEAEASRRGWRAEWDDDWTVGDHRGFYGESYPHEPTSCERCTICSADGRILASLGCIDDADHAYRRVVEAELAAEALANLAHAETAPAA